MTPNLNLQFEGSISNVPGLREYASSPATQRFCLATQDFLLAFLGCFHRHFHDTTFA